jgi:2-polyprenyl-3-methyl-5-hydroxy-6-metoxy-1,4-benzoquinol methylase
MANPISGPGTSDIRRVRARPARGPVCPVCASAGCTRSGTLLHTQVYLCGQCRVEFAWPQPSSEDLDKLYGELYFTENPKFAMAECDYLQQIVDRHILRVVPSLSGLRVLDFGCGEGNMLAVLRRMGAEAYGVEYDNTARRKASNATGAPIWKTLNEAPSHLSFDLVIMNEVLEHLLRPTVTCKDIYARIRTNGGCYVSTPNFGGLKAKIIGGRWVQYANMTHLCYFNWRSLRYLGRIAGFSRVLRIPTRVRFSTMGFAQQMANTLLSAMRLDSGLKAYFWK